jgi:TPR repeat protein
MRRFVFVLAFLASSACWAGTDEASAAYKRGDYVKALLELRPLAERGDATAQSNLGFMYRAGKGVSQDYLEAAKWYRLAASQGFAPAQFNLGVMYAKGAGVPKDNVEAYAWWTLAAAQGNKIAARNRDLVRNRMTQQQFAKAAVRATELASGALIKQQLSERAKPEATPINLVRGTQAALASKGYKPGPSDGVMGRKTRVAISAFQRSIGLPETGRPSAELLILLRAK